jgi:hypothetical protein
MGRGQRHSKNAGTMGCEGLSYHERKAMGIGTFKERLGKDSQGNYYDCCLTLQSAVDPVVTPGGFIYSREAILENLLAQKKAIKRKLREWEEQQKEQQRKVRAPLAARSRPPRRRRDPGPALLHALRAAQLARSPAAAAAARQPRCLSLRPSRPPPPQRARNPAPAPPAGGGEGAAGAAGAADRL